MGVKLSVRVDKRHTNCTAYQQIQQKCFFEIKSKTINRYGRGKTMRKKKKNVGEGDNGCPVVSEG